MKLDVCPFCRKKMVLRRLEKTIQFRGVTISYETEAFVCTECGLEAGTVESAGKTQCAIADAFRMQKKMLTGTEIKRLRESGGLTQTELARRLEVGADAINRWEQGGIQSPAMDRSLKKIL